MRRGRRATFSEVGRVLSMSGVERRHLLTGALQILEHRFRMREPRARVEQIAVTLAIIRLNLAHDLLSRGGGGGGSAAFRFEHRRHTGNGVVVGPRGRCYTQHNRSSLLLPLPVVVVVVVVDWRLVKASRLPQSLCCVVVASRLQQPNNCSSMHPSRHDPLTTTPVEGMDRG